MTGQVPSPWCKVTTGRSLRATLQDSSSEPASQTGTAACSDRTTMPMSNGSTAPCRKSALDTIGEQAFRLPANERSSLVTLTSITTREYTQVYRCGRLGRCCRGSEFYTAFYHNRSISNKMNNPCFVSVNWRIPSSFGYSDLYLYKLSMHFYDF